MGRADNAALRPLIQRAFSFPVFLAALLVVGVFFNLCLRLMNTAELPTGHWHATFVEGDTFWHIAAGQRILRTHHWPTTNYYSFTAPHSEWLAYEWLGEVLMAATSRLGSPRALMALLTLLTSTVVLLLYYSASLASGNPKSGFAATAAALPLLGSCFSVRPQLLGYIFLLITLICLERYRRGRQTNLWALPLLFVLWVNTHGTFILGLAAIAIYGIAGLKDFRLGLLEGKAWRARQRWHLGLVFLLCVGALLVNPYGPHLLRYELGITAQPVNLTYFEEWHPLVFHEFFGVWFLLLLLAYAVGLVVLRRPQRAESVALVLLAAFLACRHQRAVVFFAIVLAPVLGGLLAEVFPAYEPDKNRPVLNAALVALFAAAVVAFFPSSARLQSLIDRTQPRRAVDYLRAHPVPGPMFNDDFWGGYLIWAFEGKRKVFIDGRSDAYEPSGVLADYIKIIQPAPEALSLLEKYRVRSCLVERRGSLCALLDAQPAWRRVYQDDLSAVFERKSDSVSSRRWGSFLIAETLGHGKNGRRLETNDIFMRPVTSDEGQLASETGTWPGIGLVDFQSVMSRMCLKTIWHVSAIGYTSWDLGGDVPKSPNGPWS